MALISSSIRRLLPVSIRHISSANKGTKQVTPSSSDKPKTVSSSSKPSDTASKPIKSKPATPEKPVGPGASKDGAYKNPEYYTYNPLSFYDIERDMKAFRLPQPSNRK